jgi:hypothetical protein
MDRVVSPAQRHDRNYYGLPTLQKASTRSIDWKSQRSNTPLNDLTAYVQQQSLKCYGLGESAVSRVYNYSVHRFPGHDGDHAADRN